MFQKQERKKKLHTHPYISKAIRYPSPEADPKEKKTERNVSNIPNI